MTRILAAVAAIATAALLAACGNGYQDPNTSTVHVYNHNVPAAVQPPATVLHVVTHVNAPPTTTKPRPTTAKATPKTAKSTKR